MNEGGSKNETFYSNTIREILQNLKGFPKIYSLLYKFENRFQTLQYYRRELPEITVPFPISKYIGVFEKFLTQKNKLDYNVQQILSLIEIGCIISLYIVLNGLQNTKCSPNDIKSNNENLYKISRLLIKLKELLLFNNNENYKNLVIVFSLFSAFGIMLLPNSNEFQTYNQFPCGIINESSIIYWSS